MSTTILNEDNAGLYSPLGFNNVSDVDLSNSSLLVTKPITGKTSSSGTLQVNVSDTGISSAFYSSFDAERYSVHYNDGAIEDLTEDQVLGWIWKSDADDESDIGKVNKAETEAYVQAAVDKKITPTSKTGLPSSW